MKKIYFFLSVLLLVFAYKFVWAQTALIDCGTESVNFNNLLSGQDDPEGSASLVCLGQQILSPDSRAKAVFSDEGYGKISVYIERGEDETFTGKVTFGDKVDIESAEIKPYANTYYVCPLDLKDIRQDQPATDFNSLPGALALQSYLRMQVLISNKENRVCSGTYFDVEDFLNKEYKRITFAELLDEELIEMIEEGAGVKMGASVGCDDAGQEERNDCFTYFYSETKDQFDNPAKNFVLRLKKFIAKSEGVFDLLASIVAASENYNYLVSSYYPNTYEASENITLDNIPSQNYKKFLEKDKSAELVVLLKDAWILEIEHTSNIDSDLGEDVLQILSTEIDDIQNLSYGEIVWPDKGEEENEDGVGEEAEEIDYEKKQNTEALSGTDDVDYRLKARLSGKIMIRVEENGEAYYINPVTGGMYYLGRPEDAFRIMREQGIGIKTADLEKIPIGFVALTGPDDDGDGLSNIFEDAISTDKNKADTDGDGYSDKSEVEGGFDPRKGGGVKAPVDFNFAYKHKGKIFLQVEDNGEAWYIYPDNRKRYFLGRPADAYNIMRTLGLGISNDNFSSLEGSLED